nr:PREDICTED: FYN-binding protein-like isoform X2 [Latimeria chalumnae]|eukprot:XP_014340449.1 PREDICTED: FYN-binding protein-like isoform X2 [Latimeria chalumnae]
MIQTKVQENPAAVIDEEYYDDVAISIPPAYKQENVSKNFEHEDVYDDIEQTAEDFPPPPLEICMADDSGCSTLKKGSDKDLKKTKKEEKEEKEFRKKFKVGRIFPFYTEFYFLTIQVGPLACAVQSRK